MPLNPDVKRFEDGLVRCIYCGEAVAMVGNVPVSEIEVYEKDILTGEVRKMVEVRGHAPMCKGRAEDWHGIPLEVLPTLNSPDDTGGFGPFSLPADHPFQPAFRLHDYMFEEKHIGPTDMGRRQADELLLKRMLLIAKNMDSSRLRMEAYLYYNLARLFGRIFWRKRI